MAKFFINRPIVAMVIAIIMVIVGVVSFLSLPVAQYPNIVPPEIAINATYVGGDALTVEQSVATPIEQQMSGVDHMNYMSSVNGSSGSMSLTVNFDMKTDPGLVDHPQLRTCLIVLLAASAISTILAAILFSQREFHVKTPEKS